MIYLPQHFRTETLNLVFNDFPTGNLNSRDVIDNGFLNSRTMWQCSPLFPIQMLHLYHEKSMLLIYTSYSLARYSKMFPSWLSLSDRYQIYLILLLSLHYQLMCLMLFISTNLHSDISFAINKTNLFQKFVMFLKQTLLKRFRNDL